MRTTDGLLTEVADPDEDVVIRLAPRGPDFEVVRDPTGMYQVRGRRVERWVQMLPLEIPDAARYLQGRLRRAGVEKALIDAGVRAGDDVLIGDTVFEFEPLIEDLPADEQAAALADDGPDLDLDLDDEGEGPEAGA